MRNLSINDCGTAHEDKLLEIYDDVVKMEKKKTGKDVTPIEKSKIEMQIAEAYQTILNNLRDAGSISQALNLLGKRITTTQVGINEISKIANDVVNEVHDVKDNETASDNSKDALAAMGAAQVIGGMAESEVSAGTIDPDPVYDGIATKENSTNFKNTAGKAEAGDENAQYTIGLIDYALYYVRLVDGEKKPGNKAMVLTLINNLSKTEDPAALGIAQKLSEKYNLGVINQDAQGKIVVDDEKLIGMYSEIMKGINPKAAEKIPNLQETIGDKLKERGKKAPKTLEDTLDNNEYLKRIKLFEQIFNRFLKTGRIDKVERLVQTNSDLARDVLNKNLKLFERAGNKKYADYLQETNLRLGETIKKVGIKPIDARKVDISDVVTNMNPKRIVSDNDREL